MRLLSTSKLEFREFAANAIPEYAILSHTWGCEEVDFVGFQARVSEETEGMRKILGCCKQSLRDGYSWCWIDTCCIDKRNSAELSEAINSMYAWYRDAKVCYAYLTDVDGEMDSMFPSDSFERSRWFTRGWTLQEMIAPSTVIFFGIARNSQEWHRLGSKSDLSSIISQVTVIDEGILTGTNVPDDYSVATRMSWASKRETTRTEDLAYCLLGLFSVNMSMIYGEGDKAFIRLQEEIIRRSEDESLFAWMSAPRSSSDYISSSGLLAKSPSYFAESGYIVPYARWESRAPYFMTNRGLRIDFPILKVDGSFLAVLDCPALKNGEQYLALAVKPLLEDGDQYVRIEPDSLYSISHTDKPRRIYVAQELPSSTQKVYPHHHCQLRNATLGESGYSLMEVVQHPDSNMELKVALTPPSSSNPYSRPTWVPQHKPFVFKLVKGLDQVAALLKFKEDKSGSPLFIAILSTTKFGLAFDIFDANYIHRPIRQEVMRSLANYENLDRGTIVRAFERLQTGLRFYQSGERFTLRNNTAAWVDVHEYIRGSRKNFFLDIFIRSPPTLSTSKSIQVAKHPEHITSKSSPQNSWFRSK